MQKIKLAFIVTTISILLTSCAESQFSPPTHLDGIWTGKSGLEITISNGDITSIVNTSGSGFRTDLCGSLRFMSTNIYAYRGQTCINYGQLYLIVNEAGDKMAATETSVEPSNSDYYSPKSPLELLEKGTTSFVSTYTDTDKAYSWSGTAVFVDGNIEASWNGYHEGMNNIISYSGDKLVNCTSTDCSVIVSGFERTSYIQQLGIETLPIYSGNATFDTFTETTSGVWNGKFISADSQLGITDASNTTLLMSEDKQFAVFKVCHVSQFTDTPNELCSAASGEIRCDGVKMNNAYNSTSLTDFLQTIIDPAYLDYGTICSVNNGDTYCDNVRYAAYVNTYLYPYSQDNGVQVLTSGQGFTYNDYTDHIIVPVSPMNYGCDVIAGERQ